MIAVNKCLLAFRCVPFVLNCCPFACAAQVTSQSKSLPNLEQPFGLHQKQGSFSDVLRTLQSLGHVNVMVDGEPVLQKADLDSEGSLRDALNSIAEKFDYNWRVSRSGVILMTKRFKNLQEQPQMHPEEMRQMVKDVRKALHLAPVNDENGRPHPYLRQLLLSLSKEQYKAITGNQPFYARDLHQDQFQLLMTSVWQFQIPHAFQKWDTLARILEGLPASYLYADPINTTSTIVTENGVEQKRSFVDVSHVVRDSISGKPLVTRLGQPFGMPEKGKP